MREIDRHSVLIMKFISSLKQTQNGIRHILIAKEMKTTPEEIIKQLNNNSGLKV